MKNGKKLYPFLLVLAGLLAACTSSPAQSSTNVVATTSIIADVAEQVSGGLLQIDTLLPVGTDPHSFDPSPQDIVKLTEAGLILANGAGLEAFLQPLIESADAGDRVVTLTDGTDFIETGAGAGTDNHDHGTVDPHTWTDPNNVLVWVDHIEQAFSDLDPVHAAEYAANAEAYRTQLRDLDAWVREQVTQIPEDQRIIVTDHTSFAYFARRYGFQQAGTLIPGYSTLAEPSAGDLASLEDKIQSLDVRAVFVGNTVNPALGERVAEDTGVQLVFIYTGSLSQPGGEADSYIKYVKYNVSAIVQALQ